MATFGCTSILLIAIVTKIIFILSHYFTYLSQIYHGILKMPEVPYISIMPE